jgi:putative endonuclease
MYYVYVLHSQKDSNLYTGYTNNLKRRFHEHNSGKTISIKHRRPFDLIYYESYLYKKDAQNREIFLKSGRGKSYLKKQMKNYFKENPWFC